MKSKKSFSEILGSLDDAVARKAARKLPAWSGIDIELPGSLALEQCSSSAAASYKAELALDRCGGRLGLVCDITGGLGSDSSAFAAVADRVQYFERDAALAEAAGRNCSALGISNIEFHCEEIGPASELPECDLIYADPARRSGLGRKLFRLGDCSPDIGVLAPLLLRKAPALMVKLSPMADISVLRESFGERLKEVHVVAVGGEVKELLCILERGSRPFGGIYAVDAVAPPEEEGVSFSFLPEEEKEAPLVLAEGLSPGQIVLEPSACMLKAGAFRLPCARFGLRKLAPSTHLYLAGPGGTPPSGLFGRFAIEELLPLNSASVRLLKSRRLRADVSARNLPLGSAELARRLGCVSDAGLHVFGCATACSGNLLILARPLRESQP